jgi:hypothetical protein
MSEYQTAKGIFYQAELQTIKKVKNTLQFMFEAFTNSFESFKVRSKQDTITIEIYSFERAIENENEEFYDFNKIVVVDNGVGFNDKEYERFLRLRDDRKGCKNKGTGRIQYLHFFDETHIESIYKDELSATGFYERKITLSKSPKFLKKNAIIRLDSKTEVTAESEITKIIFKDFLNEKDKKDFEIKTIEEIKKSLINHYLYKFCNERETLPIIKIIQFVNNIAKETLQIKKEDIPMPSQEKKINIYYSKVDGLSLKTLDKKEEFNLKAFTIPSNDLGKNSLRLISKGEDTEANISLKSLKAKDEINNNRYLFLLSSDYIDAMDSDDRGNIKIITEKALLKRDKQEIITEEEITIESIENETHKTIISLFSEIKEKEQEKYKNLKELQDMFLLNDLTLNKLKNKIGINDNDETILKKIYQADAEIIAKKDAEIKNKIALLDKLNPADGNYQEDLKLQANEFIKIIPLQNREALSHYVARRKLVLNLFDKILKQETDKLKSGGRIDEKLLHNLIFHQSSNNSEISDLWLISEEFIHFKGFSDSRLDSIEIQGEKVFGKEFTKKEKAYLNSLGESRLARKPDVLLFPEEGKCIIIEFKAPDVNVSKYLNQISSYASLIRNYTNDKFKITTFYGYLIGESIEVNDVRSYDADFIHSYHLDYMFRPSKKVAGIEPQKDGSMYTEIIKYSTLLKRAQMRNKMFIDKLCETNE